MQMSFFRNPPEPPIFAINNVQLEAVSSVKLLGIVIQNDLKWDQQVQRAINNASRRLYILSKLRRNGVKAKELISIYKSYILPTLEFGVVVWASGITVAQAQSIERIQKRALRIITYPDVLPYNDLLEKFSIDSLSTRRTQLTTRFAKSLLASPRHCHLLPSTRQCMSGRNLRHSNLLDLPRARTQRFRQSPIPHFVQLLNNELLKS